MNRVVGSGDDSTGSLLRAAIVKRRRVAVPSGEAYLENLVTVLLSRHGRATPKGGQGCRLFMLTYAFFSFLLRFCFYLFLSTAVQRRF